MRWLEKICRSKFLEAWRDLRCFAGCTEWEMELWLRQILLNDLSDLVRQYDGTAKRRLSREVSGAAGDMCLAKVVSPVNDSPVHIAIAREAAEMMNRTLIELPEDYLRVLVLRHFGAMRFASIGLQMGRTPEAARKLWRRAIQRLKSELLPADVA